MPRHHTNIAMMMFAMMIAYATYCVSQDKDPTSSLTILAVVVIILGLCWAGIRKFVIRTPGVEIKSDGAYDESGQ